VKTLILSAILSACVQEAPPMQGKCTEIEVDHYDGRVSVGPTLRCSWHGRSWDCTQFGALLGGSYWSCDATGVAPAEAHP
jgi:hypothetical protein